MTRERATTGIPEAPAGAGAVRVRLLGTGNAFSSDGRLPATSLLEWEGGSILVDPGPAVLAALARAGVAANEVSAIVITHHHGDHIGGYPLLRIARKFLPGGDNRPLVIFGPVGTRERLELLWRAYYPDIEDVAEPVVVELERRGQGLDIAGARTEVVPMVHQPNSIGFRFHVGGRSVAFSGDTAFGDCVVELCRGMDLAVLECTLLDEEKYTHVSLAEVRRGRHLLDCGLLVLNHTDDRIVRSLSAQPLPRTLVAADGDVLVVDRREEKST